MSTCRVYPELPMPPAELIDRYRKLSSSLVSDSFDRWAGAVGLVPVSGFRPGNPVVGPAMTVRTRPGDNLVVHKALDLGRPGEVLVIGANGAADRAILGGLMGHYAKVRGFEGLIVDGAVRDPYEMDRDSPPVFARGLSHLGPYKSGPGDIRCSVSIAGVVVHDGDLVVADEDGVAVVPRERVNEVITIAESIAAKEAKANEEIANGTWDRPWVDETLDVVHINRRDQA